MHSQGGEGPDRVAHRDGARAASRVRALALGFGLTVALAASGAALAAPSGPANAPGGPRDASEAGAQSVGASAATGPRPEPYGTHDARGFRNILTPGENG